MVSFAGFAFVTGFLLGLLAVVAAEVAALLYLVKRLNRKRNLQESSSDPTLKGSDPPPQNPIDFNLNKQGVIWVLELDESLKDKLSPKEQQKKKSNLLEVHPVRKFARIKDHKLILTDADSNKTVITLKGCSVEAVSGSELPTRKWAKRFPIKVERKASSDLSYKGNSVFYIYLETSWEKESWCKALRLAASNDHERFTWSTKLKDEFRSYMASLNAAYPSFLKPSAGFSFESLDKGVKIDNPSSKVRLFWKKFSKKCSTKVPNREDKKTTSTHSNGSSGKSNPAGRKIRDNNIPEETDVVGGAFSRSWSQGTHASSDVDSEDKFFADEGTLAWNLLISRLFFDLKQNTGLKSAVHERIQRVLSNMRIPSYIGDVICCDVKMGSLPPYIHGARILPMEMNGVWAFELDVEYTGGAGLEVQTRVDAREEDLQMAEGKLQPNSSGDVPSDLLEGLADFEKQLSVPGGTVDGQDVKIVGSDKADEPKGSKGTKAAPNNGSKWKSILKNIAEQVSQVPITLSIGVSSLRGTLRVHMKPPPSDQLWFGFTSMPEIEFDLVSSVGEHKITNSHVAMFLINRFKTGIREVMVLPNCESVTIPWMIAEKDDWVQRSVAPFMWLNQDSTSDHNSFEAAEAKAKGGEKPPNAEQTKKATNVPQKPRVEEEPVAAQPPANSSAALTVVSDRSLEELKTPLLESSEKQETVAGGGNEGEIVPVSVQPMSRSIVPNEEVDSSFKGKKMGTRERMFDFRKKVGEKFEEKKRHMEERSRQIVEKMRGP